MSKKKIAVISDTHSKLRPEVMEILKSSDYIIHAGDFTNEDTLNALKDFDQFTAVLGNCDKRLVGLLPEEALMELFGKKIYIVHNIKTKSEKAEEADIIISGHSHIYKEENKNGKFYLNPGSCGPKRFGRPATLAILEINTDSGNITTEKIDIDEIKNPPKSKDLYGLTKKVLKDLNRNKSVKEIKSKSNKKDKDLIDQICQIYFTHPGIDIIGILDRIDIKDL